VKPSGVRSQIFRDANLNMTDPLINIVTKTLMVQDALKKPVDEKFKKTVVKKKKPNKKDPKRIIDAFI
jgi:hypothetical protein